MSSSSTRIAVRFLARAHGHRALSCSVLALALTGTGCAAAPAPVKPLVATTPVPPPPPPPPVDPLASPPASGILKDAKFPTIEHSRLDNGLELRVVTRKTYPIIELRLVLFSGVASDGAEPGVAGIAGELLKQGGAGPFSAAELAERAESLGSSLEVTTDRDATRITMAVTTADLDAALDWAAKSPSAAYGAVEVRPVLPPPAAA